MKHVSIVKIIISTSSLNYNYSKSSSKFNEKFIIWRLVVFLYKTSFPRIHFSSAKYYHCTHILNVAQTLFYMKVLLLIEFNLYATRALPAHQKTLVKFSFGVNKILQTHFIFTPVNKTCTKFY